MTHRRQCFFLIMLIALLYKSVQRVILQALYRYHAGTGYILSKYIVDPDQLASEKPADEDL